MQSKSQANTYTNSKRMLDSVSLTKLRKEDIANILNAPTKDSKTNNEETLNKAKEFPSGAKSTSITPKLPIKDFRNELPKANKITSTETSKSPQSQETTETSTHQTKTTETSVPQQIILKDNVIIRPIIAPHSKALSESDTSLHEYNDSTSHSKHHSAHIDVTKSIATMAMGVKICRKHCDCTTLIPCRCGMQEVDQKVGAGEGQSGQKLKFYLTFLLTLFALFGISYYLWYFLVHYFWYFFYRTSEQ